MTWAVIEQPGRKMIHENRDTRSFPSFHFLYKMRILIYTLLELVGLVELLIADVVVSLNGAGQFVRRRGSNKYFIAILSSNCTRST